jgi:6,7-dimethyl-8-ribityllumazine synthase
LSTSSADSVPTSATKALMDSSLSRGVPVARGVSRPDQLRERGLPARLDRPVSVRFVCAWMSLFALVCAA